MCFMGLGSPGTPDTGGGREYNPRCVTSNGQRSWQKEARALFREGDGLNTRQSWNDNGRPRERERTLEDWQQAVSICETLGEIEGSQFLWWREHAQGDNSPNCVFSQETSYHQSTSIPSTNVAAADEDADSCNDSYFHHTRRYQCW